MAKSRSFLRRHGFFVLNVSGVVYAWTTILSLIIFGCRFCPSLETEDTCVYYVAAGWFVVLQCAANFVCFHYFAYRNRVDYISATWGSRRKAAVVVDGLIEEKSDDDRTMKFCSRCDQTVPKRSHHCPICNFCVLKNDHHCFVLGGCAGFGNQRYFVLFCFWAFVGGYYGAWMAARYFNKFMVEFWPFGVVDYFFPLALIKWIILQPYEASYLAYSLLISLGYTGGSGALMFFILQWVFILSGKTMHEFFKNRKKERSLCDRVGSLWRVRIEQVFGPCWYLNFLFPLPFRNKADEDLMKFLYECQMKTV